MKLCTCNPAGNSGIMGSISGKNDVQVAGLGPADALPVSAGPPIGLPSCTQENLLLSVLPAHISMGMKLAIIERLKEGGDNRHMPDNNFHSLYVKRHQNVRWAGLGKCMVHGIL